MLFQQIVQLIPNTGGNFTITPPSIPDYCLIFPTSGSLTTLIGNVSFVFATTPSDGTRVEFEVPANQFLLGSETFLIQGNNITQVMLTTGGRFVLTWSNGGSLEFDFVPNLVNTISGVILTNNTVALNKLTGLNSGQIIIGNPSNIPIAVSPSGDVTINDSGTTTIQPYAVTNTKLYPGPDDSAKVTNHTGSVTDIVLNTNQYLGNIGSGIQAVTLSPSGLNNVAWVLTGNSGTNSSTNFIGTTDGNALSFRVNNVLSGQISTLSPGNVSLGYQSLFNNTLGNGITAIGSQALYNNSNGIYNTAVGNMSFFRNTTGSYNTAIGLNTALYNTSGSNLVAIGYNSLENNTSGSNNIAIGVNSGNTNSTGSNNIAIGYYADNQANNYSNAISLGNSAVATASGQFCLSTNVTSLNFSGITSITTALLPSYINQTAAIAGGLGVGAWYTLSTNPSGLPAGILCQVL